MSKPKTLNNFLNEDNKIICFPTKRKMKLIVLSYISTKFEINHYYKEKEVNDIINQNCIFCDPATIRRKLYQNEFMNRQKDGQTYWKEEKNTNLE